MAEEDLRRRTEATLRRDFAALDPFLSRHDSELTLVVRGGENESMPAAYFTPEQLRQIADLGCAIDIYC